MTRAHRSSLIAAIGALVAFAGYLVVTRVTAIHETPFAGPASETPPTFADRTIELGVIVSHRQGDDRLTGADESLGSGACALDYDGDGFVDLFMVNGSGDTRYYGQHQWWQTAPGHRLLRNVDGKRFVDVTSDVGIGAVTHGLGCVAADFDGDGDPDLLITNVGENLLLRNEGNGSFTNATAGSGLAGAGWQTAAAVADVDGDGDLDVYVGGFIDLKRGARAYEPGSQFKQDMEVYFDPSRFPAIANHLFKNLGGLRFEEVVDPTVADNDGRTLAAIWTDVNDDGLPDLIVANAAGTGSTTGFLNKGRWRFEPLGIESRIQAGTSFRAIAVGDVDNDGRAELVLTGASGNQTLLLFRGTADDGAPVFTDRSRQWELTQERYSAFSPWTPLLADFNNDGWPDLLVGNGQIKPDADTPHVTVGQPTQLWLNGGRGRFVEFTPPARSPLLDVQSTRGIVSADFNNDGKVDVYLAHNNDLGELLVNESATAGHFIGIKLAGAGGNTEAVGARVAVTTAEGTQVKWVTKGSGFLSDSDPRLHFGLGGANRASVAVRWPDGGETSYRNVQADTYVAISRREGLDPAAPTSPATVAPPAVPEGPARAAYIEALAKWQGDDAAPEVRERLIGALGGSSEDARLAVVRVLSKRPSSNALGILLRLLDDPSAGVTADAVDAVCAYEDETIVRFLLRMFDHEAGAVRARVSACFEHYFAGFEQQQAVIHRKYLAIPYLVRALDDEDTTARIAAIRALAAAERFRGVPPLIELLNSSEGTVQTNAIRALGLIRDRYALPPLLEFLQRDGLPAASYAETFIALARLGHEQLGALLDEFANGRGVFGRVEGRTRIEAFLDVVRSPEGVVIAPSELRRFAAAAYRSDPRTEGDALAYAQFLALAGVAGDAATLSALTSHPRPAVRSAAYVARFALAPAERTAVVTAALSDPDPAVRTAILERASRDLVALPEAPARAALEDARTRVAALKALRALPSASLTDLVAGWARAPGTDQALRAAAVEALDRSNKMFAPAESWYAGASDDLLVAMLACETRRLPAIFVSTAPPEFLQRYLKADSAGVRGAAYRFLLTREEIWAKQPVVALLAGQADEPLRRQVFAALPAGYFQDDAVLARIAARRDDPLRLDALRRLDGTRGTESVTTLRSIAGDTSEDRGARLLAASALPPADRAPLLSQLL